MRKTLLVFPILLAETTVELNPLHPGWLNMAFSVDHYMHGSYQEGLTAAEKINLPGDVQAAALVAANLGRLGRSRQAQASLEILRADERFASDPLAEMTRYFVSEKIAIALAKGLALAGFEG